MRVPMGPNRLKEIVPVTSRPGGGLDLLRGLLHVSRGTTVRGAGTGPRWPGSCPWRSCPSPTTASRPPEGAPHLRHRHRPSRHGRNRLERPADLHGLQPNRGTQNGGRLLGSIGEDDPLMAVGEHGAGRVLATVAPTPHRTGAATSCAGRITDVLEPGGALGHRGEGRHETHLRGLAEHAVGSPGGGRAGVELLGATSRSPGARSSVAEYGYDGIDVIFAEAPGDPGRGLPALRRGVPRPPARARPRVRLHRRALDLRLPAPLRPRARHRRVQGRGRRRRGPRRRLGLHAARRRLLRPAAERPAVTARMRGRRPSARSARWRRTRAERGRQRQHRAVAGQHRQPRRPAPALDRGGRQRQRCGRRWTPGRSTRRSSRSWASRRRSASSAT